jgi:hypothetical protein
LAIIAVAVEHQFRYIKFSFPLAQLKRYTHKTSGFKTSGFKTSGFKTFETSGLQNVRFTKRQIYKTLVYKTSGLQNVRFTKRQVFKTSGCKMHPETGEGRTTTTQRRSFSSTGLPDGIATNLQVSQVNPQILLQPRLRSGDRGNVMTEFSQIFTHSYIWRIFLFSLILSF